MPEVLYGRNPVLEALRAGRSLRRLLLLPGLEPDRRLEEVLRRADSAGVKAEVASRSQLNDVSHSLHHQGLAAYFDRRQLPNREALRLQVGAAPPGWPPLFICLDGVQDPQNLGALARSAEGLGASALVLSPHRNAPLSPAAVKASAGALEHLEVIRVSNLVQSLEELKQLGLTVLGLAPEGERAGHEVDLRGPLA
ncbi:MAG: TrmH family RNA methyltransferase, partial [Candidatus Dormibacteria bacterium]